MVERKIEKRQLAEIISLFLIVQFAGLLFAVYTIPPSEISLLTSSIPPSGTQGAAYVVYLAIYIVIAALILLVLFRTYKGTFAFKALEAYAIGLPTFFLAFYLVGDVFPYASIVAAAVVGALAAALLVIAKNRWPRLRNFATVIASIGIGVVIGFSGFGLAYLILCVIAVYDYVAVFVTKHMQVLARAMTERNLAFLIGSSDVEMVPGSSMSASERAGAAKASKQSGMARYPVVRRMVKEGAYPMVSQVALGGGDLALPLVLVVGAYITFSNLFVPVALIIGAAAGLVATMSLLERYKVALPAIPPLFAFMNLALAVSLLVTHSVSAYVSLLFLAIASATMAIIIVTLMRNEATAAASAQQAGARH